MLTLQFDEKQKLFFSFLIAKDPGHYRRTVAQPGF